MDASHDHGTSLKNLSVNAPWLADVMNRVLLDHLFRLALVYWDKTGRGELSVPRSDYVFCLNRR